MAMVMGACSDMDFFNRCGNYNTYFYLDSEVRAMKIRVTETYIEADARELRESGTLADNFTRMLSRCFQSTEKFDDDVDDVEEDESE